jgi:hypothetical protein
MLKMSANVIASMKEWEPDYDVSDWALSRAVEIMYQTVPSVDPDSSNMLYCLPAGLKMRLLLDIARALADTSARTECKEKR